MGKLVSIILLYNVERLDFIFERITICRQKVHQGYQSVMKYDIRSVSNQTTNYYKRLKC